MGRRTRCSTALSLALGSGVLAPAALGGVLIPRDADAQTFSSSNTIAGQAGQGALGANFGRVLPPAPVITPTGQLAPNAGGSAGGSAGGGTLAPTVGGLGGAAAPAPGYGNVRATGVGIGLAATGQQGVNTNLQALAGQLGGVGGLQALVLQRQMLYAQYVLLAQQQVATAQAIAVQQQQALQLQELQRAQAQAVQLGLDPSGQPLSLESRGASQGQVALSAPVPTYAPQASVTPVQVQPAQPVPAQAQQSNAPALQQVSVAGSNPPGTVTPYAAPQVQVRVETPSPSTPPSSGAPSGNATGGNAPEPASAAPGATSSPAIAPATSPVIALVTSPATAPSAAPALEVGTSTSALFPSEGAELARVDSTDVATAVDAQRPREPAQSSSYIARAPALPSKPAFPRLFGDDDVSGVVAHGPLQSTGGRLVVLCGALSLVGLALLATKGSARG